MGSVKQQSVRLAQRMKKSLGLVISLLDYCLGQGRLVRNDWCGEKCIAPEVPAPNGEICRDDSEILRPVLMMTELKEMMETQLINLRGRLSSRGLYFGRVASYPEVAG